MTTTVMHDHPGWRALPARRVRAFRGTSSPWAVLSAPTGWNVFGPAPDPDLTDLGNLPATVPPELADSLASLGRVARWRTSDLWEAIATAIIRQVIRADQARRLFHGFCDAHGPAVEVDGQSIHALPAPETVLTLPDEAFADLGLAFKIRPLRAAARAYLENADKWVELEPRRLVEELQAVPRIGPWTAGAAVADHTHDWTLYPHGDLAVRKWAGAAAPSVAWPENDADFAVLWRRIAGDRLAALTLFTLAWGVAHGGSL